ncbi:sigma-70 family RNA polymerase sigma factor [Actinomycetospora endophytica]|uniref:Sigma-70 family RNA polymerase sigma factor n=1 Tax=Actinomycetospora endophytica TaxID=2291215 RepID=A0ABS8PHA7_9PSEU|nr:sigma-70 family RNA polymerase sigma factor [Actinomycetospora endophytica]MCD2197428.1 sigma-70 family RNA polymerase sigma factor [Actinomycetospora endophytica]
MADGGGPVDGPVSGGEPDDGSGRADARSDAELLAVVRGRPGDAASSRAFGTLYARHRDAARGLARQLARSPADAEDLVSAAFARLLEILRAGGGPTEAFRAYLLTSLRHLAYDRTRAERRLDLTEDMGDVIGIDPERTVVPFADPAVAGLERSLAARAFATLPERWQAVLWHLEVEGDSPADIAPLFGLTANAVSALGYRAREGLRQAYLQEHLAGGGAAAPPRDRRHREAEEKLGAYTRGGLSKRDAAKVEEHLRECAECRALASELREVNSGILRSTIAPLVLGAALVGYLADRAAPGVFTGSWPTTAEWVVAGGGVVGVLGSVGGVVRAAEVPRARRLGAAAVGLAGLGVATATALGTGAPAVPEAAAPAVTFPGSVLPGALPGLSPPGPAAPGALGMPSAPTVPGGSAPSGPGGSSGTTAGGVGSSGTTAGDSGPSSAAAGGPGTSARPDVARVPSVAAQPQTEESAARLSGSSDAAGASGSDDRPARRSEVASSGTVTSGTWSPDATHHAQPSSARSQPSHDDSVEDQQTPSPLVRLRVLGLGAELRESRSSHRGLLEPALDVLLR